MSRAQRIGNVLGVVLPVVGAVVAIVLLWNEIVGVEALAVLAFMYLLTGMGITVGFHRLLAHRSFETSPAGRATFAILGTMAMQGPVIRWVTNHRKHHAHPDEEGDPHSPHLSRDSGLLGGISGLWHAHVGWIFEDDRAPRERYAPDLLSDPAVAFVDRTAAIWVVAGLALPFAAGLAITGTLGGALLVFLWGGPVRIFFIHHFTFAINSLCHFVGSRRFDTKDQSRNLYWLAPFSFGESWHNNHHAFPTSAFHGHRPSEIDPGGWVIRGLERLGLVWKVNRVSPERQALKLADRRQGLAPDRR